MSLSFQGKSRFSVVRPEGLLVTHLADRPTTSFSAITTLTGVEDAELDQRVRRIMTVWIDRWGELSPEHQAKFLATAEFHELALIPTEFWHKAINRFQQREKILWEAKRLQDERKKRQRKPPRRRTARRGTNSPRQRRRDSTPSNNDPYWSASFGHRPKGRPDWHSGERCRWCNGPLGSCPCD